MCTIEGNPCFGGDGATSAGAGGLAAGPIALMRLWASDRHFTMAPFWMWRSRRHLRSRRWRRPSGGRPQSTAARGKAPRGWGLVTAFCWMGPRCAAPSLPRSGRRAGMRPRRSLNAPRTELPPTSRRSALPLLPRHPPPIRPPAHSCAPLPGGAGAGGAAPPRRPSPHPSRPRFKIRPA